MLWFAKILRYRASPTIRWAHYIWTLYSQWLKACPHLTYHSTLYLDIRNLSVFSKSILRQRDYSHCFFYVSEITRSLHVSQRLDRLLSILFVRCILFRPLSILHSFSLSLLIFFMENAMMYRIFWHLVKTPHPLSNQSFSMLDSWKALVTDK